MTVKVANETLYYPYPDKIQYMIPDFNEHGNIPIGEFEPTLPEFRTRFVDDFNTSTTREDLYKNYINYNLFLSTFNVAEKEWVPGSFTSAKIDPEDVDLLIYIDGIRLITGGEENDFWTIFDPNEIFFTYNCHIQLIVQYPDGDIRNEHYRHKREYFESCFKKDRSDRPRGIIKFDLLSTQYKSDLEIEAEV